jgi:hypothetical protein
MALASLAIISSAYKKNPADFRQPGYPSPIKNQWQTFSFVQTQ